MLSNVPQVCSKVCFQTTSCGFAAVDYLNKIYLHEKNVLKGLKFNRYTKIICHFEKWQVRPFNYHDVLKLTPEIIIFSPLTQCSEAPRFRPPDVSTRLDGTCSLSTSWRLHNNIILITIIDITTVIFENNNIWFPTIMSHNTAAPL